MGANKDIEDAYDFEMPRHEVTISKGFFLGKYEVTQEQWEKVMGSNPSSFKNPRNPVENISFEDVQNFIRRLNKAEKTGKYRLPTEAEWEYAARAGSDTIYSFGDGPTGLDRYAWYDKNSGGRPHPVGSKEPNIWGLHDMHGNINEWVQDRFDEGYYSISPSADPGGPPSGTGLKRGGSWFLPPKHVRAAFRDGIGPDFSDKRGFRLAFTPE